MTRRTTAEWEAFLDSASDGPWKAWGEDEDGTGRPDNSRIMRGAAGEYLGIMHTPAADLAALAPEAVAKLVNMRGALDSLATWCETKAMKARNYPRPGAQQQMERTAIIYEELARRVTEILETDLNEEDDDE